MHGLDVPFGGARRKEQVGMGYGLPGVVGKVGAGCGAIKVLW